MNIVRGGLGGCAARARMMGSRRTSRIMGAVDEVVVRMVVTDTMNTAASIVVVILMRYGGCLLFVCGLLGWLRKCYIS